MPHPSRIYPSDEELGKRNDDYRPTRTNSWLPWRSRPAQYRKRRIVVLLLAGLLIWLLWTNLPDSYQIGRVAQIVAHVPGERDDSADPVEPTGPPPHITDRDAVQASEHYFSGSIRFFRLADSLHAISNTLGHRPTNRNILFAAAHPKSAATLLPMACEMARLKRNFVHMAIMGRDDISIAELKEINGINDKDCTLYWHDARPDYSKWSSDTRMSASVSAALNHINSYMHPQVIFIDASDDEDGYFSKAVTTKGNSLEISIIPIPDGKLEDFLWAARLDSGSLSAWFKPTIDVLVHAPAKTSGSLIRLLRSLERTDYSGFPPPRLTIELPSDADKETRNFISKFVWPPQPKGAVKDPLKRQELMVIHRIARERASPEEASIRLIESFYPSKSSDSHVVLLSPQAELSPRWFHYLYYIVLEHKYSPYQLVPNRNLAGVSLENPSLHLDGSSTFKSPTVADVRDEWYSKYAQDLAVPFLWQAPNANAALYFGDKWAELHSFLTYRLTNFHNTKASGDSLQRQKLISSSQPAWTEYLLELMRARGYTLLYPGSSDSSDALATVHNNPSLPAEEFDKPPSDSKLDSKAKPDPNEPFTLNPADSAALLAAESLPTTDSPPASQAASLPLHALLPFDGALPDLTHIPMLAPDGTPLKSLFASQTPDDRAKEAHDAAVLLDDDDLDSSNPPSSSSSTTSASLLAARFAAHFRATLGGCPTTDATRPRVLAPGSARDLFCLGDGSDEFDDGPARANPAGEATPRTDPERSWNVKPGDKVAEEEAAAVERKKLMEEGKRKNAAAVGVGVAGAGVPEGWVGVPTVEEARRAEAEEGGDEVAEAVRAAKGVDV
ncbi:MAG: hypothetical protein M1822_003427 [Bathelium mastoideum]|nr:MAG: hypothetical protein M1822_003427 [Bathelium mastoideum]